MLGLGEKQPALDEQSGRHCRHGKGGTRKAQPGNERQQASGDRNGKSQ